MPFDIADLENNTECLISIDAENKIKVDEILAKAEAGATVYARGGKKMAGCMLVALLI
ncbi:hypothetical protein [Pedobacter helvus]|uniref:Uncharacterized protein n=1 Tax=Pedobacter helvus TaxID=2563444 RepID=A0ABW9JMA4_9SPHI|nr:hypothetical protein [Pedobacter ureilyticus]